MTQIQTAILIALILLGVLSLVVGLVLRHYIGGFIQTVEKEAEEQARAEEEERAAALRDRGEDGRAP